MVRSMPLRVLLTGACAGAGRRIAERFAARGDRVTAIDIDPRAVETFAAANPEIRVRTADVADEGDVGRLFATFEAEDGGLDVLVNNVGIGGPTLPIDEIPLDAWRRTLDVNLTGCFLCARAAARLMKAQRSGLILSISSASARVGLPLRTPYVVSKAGVLSLTRNLARELGPSGVRVNAILPGAIEGERIEGIIRDKAVALGVAPDAYAREMFQYISLRTMVRPDDIAEMAMFLASPAGARISGQLIGVDGNVEYEV